MAAEHKDKDRRDGQRRLDDPDDFVRLEIETALERNIRVIPVLFEGARLPRAGELPASLSKLVRRHALELSPSRFDVDIGKLLKVLDTTLADEHARRKEAAKAAREAEEQTRREAEATAAREAEEQARQEEAAKAAREAEGQTLKQPGQGSPQGPGVLSICPAGEVGLGRMGW